MRAVAKDFPAKVFEFQAKYPDACWSWPWRTDRDGYGILRWNGKKGTTAHRAAYELLNGPLLKNVLLWRVCPNPWCFNPKHVEPRTKAEDNRRRAKHREPQPKGPYTPPMPFAERLALIRRGPDDCWIWQWAKTPSGYGHVVLDGRHQYTHRAAYELLVGPIPAGCHLDHMCMETSCCNPSHLRVRTPRQHKRRHQHERRECVRGHDLTAPNAWRYLGRGRRECRLCRDGWNLVRFDPVAAIAYRATGRQRLSSSKSKHFD